VSDEDDVDDDDAAVVEATDVAVVAVTLMACSSRFRARNALRNFFGRDLEFRFLIETDGAANSGRISAGRLRSACA
jgi:hypothetical protein